MGKQILNGVVYGNQVPYRELTKAEYDALPNSKYTDGIMYYIRDVSSPDSFGTPHKYSTDEQIVGTWIDGKPIYEKTIILENSIECRSGSWTSIGITASSLSISSYVSCIGYTADGTCWNGMFIATINSDIAIMIIRPNETCWVKTLVIQYTKSS